MEIPWQRFQNEHLSFTETLGLGIGHGSLKALLVDGAETVGRNLQRNPLILGCEVEFFLEQVGKKLTFGLPVGVGNIVSNNHLLSCDFANP